MKRLFVTYKSLTLSLLFIFLFSVTVSFASPLYNSQNTTLNPQCAPTDPDCTVAQSLLTGLTGGQSLIGGTSASDTLTLSSTSNSTKGKILFGTSAYDEVNNRLGIGTINPTHKLEVAGDIALSGALYKNGIQVSLRTRKTPLSNWFNNGITGKKILVVGDSTSTGSANAAVLYSQLATYQSSGRALAGTTIVDFGSNGNTAENFITTNGPKGLAAAIAEQADLYVISYGINDVRQGQATQQQIEERLTTIVNTIRAQVPEADIILRMPNSFSATDGGAGYVVPSSSAQAYTDILRNAYLNLEGNWPNVTLFKTQPSIFSETSLSSSSLMSDQIHPSASGYRAIADALVALIGSSTGSQWVSTDTGIYYPTGNVSIGTTDTSNSAFTLTANYVGNGFNTPFTVANIIPNLAGFPGSAIVNKIVNIQPTYNSFNIANGSSLVGINVDMSANHIGTAYAAIFQGGYVGIGTSAPTSELSVVGNVQFTGYLTGNGVTTARNIFNINPELGGFPGSAVANTILNITPTYNAWNNTNGAQLVGLNIDLSGNSSGLRYAALFQGGYVGIGTATPTTTLDVVGDFKLTGDINLNNYSTIKIGNATQTVYGGAVVLTRNLDDSYSGSPHGFDENSTLNRSGGLSMNAFDARSQLTGNHDYNHFVGFQEDPTASMTGTLENLVGFSSGPGISNGTVNNRIGLSINDTIPSGGGILNNQYGVKISGLVGGTNNWAIWTAAPTASYFGGAVKVGGSDSLPGYPLDVFGSIKAGYSTTDLVVLNASSLGTGQAGMYLSGGSSYSEIQSIYEGVSTTPLIMQRKGGTVGIGIVEPDATLAVVGNIRAGSSSKDLVILNGGFTSGKGGLYINGGADTYSELQSVYEGFGFSPIVLQRRGGLVGIATTTPSYTLSVGNSTISGIVSSFQNSTGTCTINPTTTALSCSSDRNLKKDITVLDTNTLNKVLSLQPVTYHWNTESSTDSTHAGFIAQEVEAIFPDLVSTDPKTGLKSLAYTGLIPYTVKAIQDINIKVSAIPTYSDTTLYTTISTFLDGIAQRGEAVVGSVKAQLVTSDQVTTKKLCLDDVCVTKEQLQYLINNVPAATQTVQVVPETPQTPIETPAATEEVVSSVAPE